MLMLFAVVVAVVVVGVSAQHSSVWPWRAYSWGGDAGHLKAS